MANAIMHASLGSCFLERIHLVIAVKFSLFLVESLKGMLLFSVTFVS